jgi:hypothetical protein
LGISNFCIGNDRNLFDKVCSTWCLRQEYNWHIVEI